MFELLKHYYHGVDYQRFLIDLNEKSHVILLFSSDQIIQGFSTLLVTRVPYKNKSCLGIFSGDTVLDRAYWGNGDLAMAFGRFLLAQKLKSPLSTIYWFLISKGYKTYLLMTNNFPTHYPRYERPTPENIKQIMHSFYQMKFNSSYNSQEGLIQFGSNISMRLKEKVADIDEASLKHPRIQFFNQTNPNWRDGVELACVAKVSLFVPFYYVFKYIRKQSISVFKIKRFIISESKTS